MVPIQAVLLDMGGVLLEMANAAGLPQGKLDWRGREVLAQLLRRQGGHLGVEDLESLLFAPWRAVYARRYETGREASWAPHLKSLRRATGCRLRDATLLGAWFQPYGEQLTPIVGALEAVRELQQGGLHLGLVSNVALPGVLYERVLRRHGFLAALPVRQFSYDSGSRKPSPAMLRAALLALGVDPAAAVMVGDRRGSDVAAGRAAGLRTIWLRSADGGGPRPDLEIDSMSELPAVIGSRR
ncbi:MAG: HAD family hydrolase [Acidobacteriota bacterium]